MTLQCGPLTFSSDFDSGNFYNVELVTPVEGAQGTSFNNQVPDYEVNVWTKPDCFGTQFQNGNRTWFYFGVKGGKPNAVLKINILNLNKQTKLFEQGMQPVYRYVPEKPHWERVKDKTVLIPSGVVKEGSCGISFRHRLPLSPSSTLFIAFTFPFSYSEMCEWLDEIDASISLNISINHNLTPNSPIDPHNQIYYARECVCLSLEGRRVELLTITSLHGQSNEREEYLANLFPFRETEPRPHKFPTKKIIFISSRVHPGEVPAQFVFNGFLKFLLDEIDPRACALRRLFVFKLIPMLNPDGVFHGHYRTDPRGVNLNRVYLQPSPFLHPSIYAARKLLLYAHLGSDSPDDYEYEVGGECDEGSIGSSNVCAGCIDDAPLPPSCPDDDCSLASSAHQCTFESCDDDSVMDFQDVKKTSNYSQNIALGGGGGGVNSGGGGGGGKNRRSRGGDFEEEKESGKKISKIGRTRSLSSALSAKKVKESDSGLFLYVDMHGHATKRGIFMYGNHFKEAEVQAECMLLPRLMALNCQHFDFSSCNFTEKLMSVKDRRDGSSREGSGRVAVLKMSGLIRSYTLECNYNTGRLVNHLISRPDSYGLHDPPQLFHHHSPKFTPHIYEDVGKSLAESILDLHGHNPYSRLKFSEFRSLDGLRSFLIRRLHNTPEYRERSDSLLRRTSVSTLNFIPLLKRSASTRTVNKTLGPLVPKKENQSAVPKLSKKLSASVGSTPSFDKSLNLAEGKKGSSGVGSSSSSNLSTSKKLSKKVKEEQKEQVMSEVPSTSSHHHLLHHLKDSPSAASSLPRTKSLTKIFKQKKKRSGGGGTKKQRKIKRAESR